MARGGRSGREDYSSGSEGEEEQDVARMVASEDVGMRLNYKHRKLDGRFQTWLSHSVGYELYWRDSGSEMEEQVVACMVASEDADVRFSHKYIKLDCKFKILPAYSIV